MINGTKIISMTNTMNGTKREYKRRKRRVTPEEAIEKRYAANRAYYHRNPERWKAYQKKRYRKIKQKKEMMKVINKWDETKLDKLPSPEMGKCDGFCDDKQKLLIAISKQGDSRYCAECAKWIMEDD